MPLCAFVWTAKLKHALGTAHKIKSDMLHSYTRRIYVCEVVKISAQSTLGTHLAYLSQSWRISGFLRKNAFVKVITGYILGSVIPTQLTFPFQALKAPSLRPCVAKEDWTYLATHWPAFPFQYFVAIYIHEKRKWLPLRTPPMRPKTSKTHLLLCSWWENSGAFPIVSGCYVFTIAICTAPSFP